MAQSTGEGWQELQVPSRRQCPKLFYSFFTHEESITLLLTDLISIWESSLDKPEILREAARQHTSIDPSVSTDQFRVLLTKLRKSLKDGENALARGNGSNSQVLLLQTKADLPRPLRPLEWTFILEPQTASELAEQILRPSLHEVSVSQDKITSLLRIIKDKDHVISRLLERTGNSAADLGLFFPGITGFASRKGGHVSVADAKKHVPGMASFDEKSWTQQFSNDDGYQGADRTGLSNLVRGCEKCFAHTKADHESWIKGLSSSNKVHQTRDRSSQAKSPVRKAPPQKPEPDDESTDSNDDFERQRTPPLMNSKSSEARKAARVVADDEDTESADGKPPSKRAKLSKIGGLGRRNATKEFGASKGRPKSSSPPAAAPSPPAHRRPSDASTATASASEDNTDDERRESSKKGQSKGAQLDQKSKFGRLKKKEAPSTSPSPSPPPSQPREFSPAPSPIRPPESRQLRAATASSNRGLQEVDDLNGAASPPPEPRPKPSTPTKHRLGRVGGRNATTTPNRSKSPSTTPDADGGSGMKTTSQACPSTDAARPSRKLGHLRGQRQREQDKASSADPSPPTSGNQATSQKAAKDHGADSDRTGSPSPRPSRSHSPSTSKPTFTGKHVSETAPSTQKPRKSSPVEEKKKEKEETAEEKANRRRAELKRSIEASKAGGRKNKRRF